MVQAINFKWPQGEDLKIRLLYKEGESAARAVAVPLANNFAVRMDLVVPSTSESVYSYISSNFQNTLGDGKDKQPNINITLPRSLTLPGGSVYVKMQSKVLSFNYDIFLRNNLTNTQTKILRGTVTLEASNTLWA